MKKEQSGNLPDKWADPVLEFYRRITNGRCIWTGMVRKFSSQGCL